MFKVHKNSMDIIWYCGFALRLSGKFHVGMYKPVITPGLHEAQT